MWSRLLFYSFDLKHRKGCYGTIRKKKYLCIALLLFCDLARSQPLPPLPDFLFFFSLLYICGPVEIKQRYNLMWFDNSFYLLVANDRYSKTSLLNIINLFKLTWVFFACFECVCTHCFTKSRIKSLKQCWLIASKGSKYTKQSYLIRAYIDIALKEKKIFFDHQIFIDFWPFIFCRGVPHPNIAIWRKFNFSQGKWTFLLWYTLVKMTVRI